jgi:hypothetical protein
MFSIVFIPYSLLLVFVILCQFYLSILYHFYLFIYFFLAEIRPVVIIGDSIIKNISPIEEIKIQSFPGATIGRLAYLVSQHKNDLYDKSFIVVHVGIII